MEHWLALISKYSGKGVYYPPIDDSKCLIFTFGSYEKWTLRRLNEMSYEEIVKWVELRGIHYPVDINV
jgi:hypothetical protein